MNLIILRQGQMTRLTKLLLPSLNFQTKDVCQCVIDDAKFKSDHNWMHECSAQDFQQSRLVTAIDTSDLGRHD
ncbi:hypothetical protein TNCV_4677941 [Trichonephila clavipes]|nr:hypothetical protein TNCV_4677941 [Trichonephila clavipes]